MRMFERNEISKGINSAAGNNKNHPQWPRGNPLRVFVWLAGLPECSRRGRRNCTWIEDALSDVRRACCPTFEPGKQRL